jgi:hypothetical protein
MRSLLLAPVLAVALASPAVAASPSYDIDVTAKLAGTASGSDGDGWSSSSSFSTDIAQSYRGLKDDPTPHGDEEVTADAATPPRLAPSTLNQQYALVTALDTIRWSCAPEGWAKADPGSVQVTRLGDKGSLYMFLLDGKVTQARKCNGYSGFSGTIDITTGPVTVPPTEFSWATLQKKGSVTVPINRMATCGEWTIYQTACSLRLTGTVTIKRSGTPQKTKPTVKVKGQPWHGGKGAKVKVTCSSACKGKVSAAAVAKGGKGAKPLGSKAFSSQGGTKSVTVIYGKGGARTARQRGAVIITVKSSGAKASYRMRTR